MNNLPNPHEEWFRLFAVAVNGDITDGDHESLQRLLKTNSEARQLWFEYNDVECGLSELRPFSVQQCFVPFSLSDQPLAVVPKESEVSDVPSRTVPKWLPLAAAAAVTLGVGIQQGLLPIPSLSPANYTARFGQMHDPLWASPADSFKAGDSIGVDQVVELFSGSVDVHFASGAEVTLVAPCIFKVTSANSAHLTLGQVKAKAATAAAKGFTIQTPTASVVDVGTEFVAYADADGKSRVEVTKGGDVQVHLAGQDQPQRLLDGGALAVEPGDSQVMIRVENGDGTPEFRFPSIEPPSATSLAAATGETSIRVLDGHKQGGSGPLPELVADVDGSSGTAAISGSVIRKDPQTGQILVDLGQEVSVSKINTYSWMSAASASSDMRVSVQKYALYGYPEGALPRTDGTLDDHGWDLIGRVDSGMESQLAPDQDSAEQKVSSISAASGSIGRYRYLLWAVQPMSGGVKLADLSSIFNEFDVYAAQ